MTTTIEEKTKTPTQSLPIHITERDKRRREAMIEKIKKMPPDAQILPRFPGQIL